MKINIKTIMAFIATLLITTGCAKEYYHHGYNFEHIKFDMIKTGQTSKEQAIKELGSPTAVTDFGEEKLYYISSKVEKIAILNPVIIEQKVLTLTIDKNGLVSDINELTLDDSNQIVFAENKTEIRGNSITAIEQIFGNIGKFNKNTKQF